MTSFSSKRVLCILSLGCFIIGIYTIEITTHIPKNVEKILKKTNGTEIKKILNNSRRIVGGVESNEGRPYMVYLQLPTNSAKYKEYRKWLCGGVIIHEEYILTSAACIEDARHFYIVSGTFIYDEAHDRYNNPCIKNGAKKAVWKCVPRNYMFDGHENDNIRWMNNDIAIVKTEDEFDFTRRIRGCDFIPRPVCYNNESHKLEEPDTIAHIAGWGNTRAYNEPITAENSRRPLLESQVQIISKSTCKKRWGKRYHNVIDNYMICTKDIIPELDEICAEKYVDCQDVSYESDEDARRIYDPEKMELHSAYHNSSNSIRRHLGSGGFCENDHGGPLVFGGHGTGTNEVVIGIISACLVKEGTNKCYGPFLYTSVWKNRILINCAIFKNPDGGCDKLFRAGGTHTEEVLSWVDHPDGPAKNELKAGASMKKIEPSQPEETKSSKASLTKESLDLAAAKLANESPIDVLNIKAASALKQAVLQAEEPSQRRDLDKAFSSTTISQLTVGTTRLETSSIGTTPLPVTGVTLKSDQALEHSGIMIKSQPDIPNV